MSISIFVKNPSLRLRRTVALLIVPCVLGGLASSGRAQQAAAQQAAAQQAAASVGPPNSHAVEAPVPLNGSDFTLSNPLGIAFAEQPVEVLLAQPAPAGTNLVVDEAGKTVGQVQGGRRRLSLRAGFATDQKERRFHLAKSAAALPAGLEHPVTLKKTTWTTEQSKAIGTTHPNGIASYYEISNGLCGVRVPSAVRDGALPGMSVPAPIVGVQHKDGEWAGRPDFRAFVVPALSSDHGNIPRADWKFTGFTSRIVEQGPLRTTVQLSITASNRAEPYRFEVTLYAGERFVKFHQLSGRLNDWFLDLSLDKKTPWHPTRWRTGGTHHFAKDVVELPDRPGQKFTLGWDKGVGPTTQHGEYEGEGEGDLFSHRDLWVEFDFDWGQARLLNKAGDGDNSHSKFAAGVRGLPLWWPWAGVGTVVYALDPQRGATSPVAGLVNGPAGEVENWEARDDPRGEAGFCQHIPAQLDLDPAVYNSTITQKYMLNDRYQGVADRDTPIFGIRFTMNTRGGSYFLWLGDNRDILPDINDPKFTVNYRSPLWQDYSRFTSGVANLQDALAWNLTWDDPAGGSLYSVEPEVIKANIERARKGENLGGSQLVNLWKLNTDAERVAAADEFIKNLREHPEMSIRHLMQRVQAEHWKIDGIFQWYTYDRFVAGRLNDLKTYFSLGRKAQGGLLSDEQWGWLKYFAAFYFQTEFDEDRAMFWNPGTDMNHGGGSMTSQGNLARLGIILDFPTWPDAGRYAALPVAEQEKALQNEFGRWGAQFTGTHYSSMAAITQPLAGLLNFQWRSYTQPNKFPDKFATDPRLRHYAFFVLNRTGVRDPRYGNVRVPIAVGNGGAGWGQPAAALLSSGFRHLDPQLSRWMMWDWQENGKSTMMTPLLPTLFDYGTPAEPYPFPAISTFPGNMTIHRSAPHTPNESGVWITDGNFFFQHREPAEAGEVHIDALGKPLVTNSTSYVFPAHANELYKNVIGTNTADWDKDNFYRGDWHSAWENDHVKAIAEYADGTYSSSEFSATDADKKGLTWQRHIIMARPDPETPIIAIRDVMSKAGEYTSTFWLQTEGAITTPDGKQVTPPFKNGSTSGKEPTPDQLPSAVKVPRLAAGASTFGFSGHDWVKLYPKSYAAKNITDVGPLVDTEVHVVDAAPSEAVVGHWRSFDHGNRFTNDTDGTYDDRQYLRVKFNGTEHITVFTPFHRGQRPADLKVAREANGAVRISYTNAQKVRRAIVITPQGYRIESNGKVTGRAVFTDKLPGKLYPQWKDVDYPGPAKP